MLFPLMVGVGAGVTLERYYLAERRSKKLWEKMKKEATKEKSNYKDGAKDSESIMDYINRAKRSHPQVRPRRTAAIKIMMILEGKENGSISRKTFEKAKAVVEEYCGIRNLKYEELGETILGGEINEECPEKPVLDVHKLECLTKEELILIAPKLKDLFANVAEHADRD